MSLNKNIKDLDFFENVRLRPVAASEPNKTDIDITVEEQSTGEISLGAGFSTVDGPLAEFSIRERNFLGKGQRLGLTASISARRNQFDINFTEPYFLKRDLSAGFDIFRITTDLQDQGAFDSQRTGGAVRIGYPLSPGTAAKPVLQIENNEITNVQPGTSAFIAQQAGARSTSAITHSLSYDTRDSRLEPTEGIFARITNEFAGGIGDAQYIMNRVSGNWFYPVYDGWVFLDRRRSR